MRKGSFQLTFNMFEDWMDVLYEITERVEAAPQAEWPINQKVEVFEAFVQRVATAWQCFAENLLVDCLNRDCSQYAEYMGLRLRKNMSFQECKALIQGLGYFDFRDVNDLRGKAKNVLVPRWNPFPSIPSRAKQKIDEFMTFRNHLAHYSPQTNRAVEKIYKKYDFSRQPEAGRFLIARSKTAKKIRYAEYMQAFGDAVDAMKNALRLQKKKSERIYAA